MKKIAAIPLIVINLFNLMGYRFLFDYLIHQNQKEVALKLDNNKHNEADLIELKIPMHLPYSRNWQEYERYDGEIEFNGIHYNFVKRKISDDTLYLFCLPNSYSTELHKNRNAYAAQASENGSSDPSGNNTNTLQWRIIFETEFNQPSFYYPPLTISVSNKKYSSYIFLLNSGFLTTPSQPPEVNS